MALSGSTNYSKTAADLIRAALLKLGVVNPYGAVADVTNNICLDALNRLIKHWQMQGAHLWTQHEAAIVFAPSVSVYTLPGPSLAGASAGVVNEDVLVTTAVSADLAASATNIGMDSTSGMAATDAISIELDDGTLHTTTIVSVDSATHVTITSGLASAASEDNFIYSYPVAANQTNLFCPKQILNVRLHYGTNQERMLTEYSREEYLTRNDRTLTGDPFSYYVEDNLTNKKLFVFPTPTNMQQSLRFTYMKALDDVDSLTNDVEFPTEWHRAIVLNLAVEVALEFGKENKLNILLPLASSALADALGWDDDSVDLQLVPDLD